MNAISASPNSAQQVFWGEMVPCDHVVQIYGDDEVFLDDLACCIGAGLQAGEGAIVLATPGHLEGLETRMRASGIDVEEAARDGQYVAALADDVLDEFMVDGWPDEQRFRRAVGALLGKARGESNRPVRAFGEMVALVWAQGKFAATIDLEILWARLCNELKFPLLCAYPSHGFTRNATESIRDIRARHSKFVPLGEAAE